LAMGCYLKDFYKKDSKYKLVKFRITDVESVTLKETKP
jgi:metal-sulfur cluster biosynthetic enzyme